MSATELKLKEKLDALRAARKAARGEGKGSADDT